MDYSALQAKVGNAIAKLGQSMTITSITSNKTISVIGVWGKDVEENAEPNGPHTLVARTRELYVYGGFNFIPLPGDIITDKTFKISSVQDNVGVSAPSYKVKKVQRYNGISSEVIAYKFTVVG